MPAQPAQIAVLLATLGVLLGISVLSSRASGRIGLPVALVFLLIGVLAASFPWGHAFGDFGMGFRLGTVALVLILFDGGLNTPLTGAVRRALVPASLLATVGVVITAAVVALGAWRFLGFSAGQALLLGAVVSSTDAAAVFSVLRGSGLVLKQRVAATIEVESGLNDPMAVVLTTALTASLVDGGGMSGVMLVVHIVMQLLVGAVMGVTFGLLGRLAVSRIKVPASGLFPVLTLALAFLSFGVTSLVEGSGFLAVYLCGTVVGNGPLPYRSGLLRVHDFVAWFSQTVMFLVLGLLVVPGDLIPVALPALAVALILTFVARPLATALCLAPFRYPLREIAYVGWVGLRGAVPIILATYPVLTGAPGADRIFHVVFFVAALNALVPGATVRQVTRWLKLQGAAPPPPQAVLEIHSTQLLGGELLTFHVNPASAVSGATIGELPFPPDAAALLIVRGRELVAARGHTRLEPGDHVYVFCHPEDRPLVLLLFGQLEEE